VKRRHAPKDAIFLHSRCHPHAPTWCAASKGSAKLLIFCAVCTKEVVVLELKPGQFSGSCGVCEKAVRS